MRPTPVTHAGTTSAARQRVVTGGSGMTKMPAAQRRRRGRLV